MSFVNINPSFNPSLNSRHHIPTFRHRPRSQWTSLFLLLACFVFSVSAASKGLPQEAGILLLDTRVPTKVDGRWVFLSQEEVERRELVKRAAAHEESSSTNSAASVTTTFSIAVSSVTQASSTTSTVSEVPASPLPSPLDGSISANFSNSGSGTNNCPAFINSFLSNPTFQQCYPFSMLLQGSQSFFEAEKSLVSITQVLDASCSANVTSCNVYLTQLAKNLTDSANCGTDYQLGNQVVVQSYLAMLSYQTLYRASCLKSQGTSAYCFANAVTNQTTPSNVYFYYLPLNITLPTNFPTERLPSCSWCLAQTMGIYQSAAADRSLPIANTYLTAAQEVNSICGPSFVNASLPNAVVAVDSSGLSLLPSWLLLALPTLAAAQWLL